METIGTWWMWASFFAIVLVMLAIDLLVVGGGKQHRVSLREAATGTLGGVGELAGDPQVVGICQVQGDGQLVAVDGLVVRGLAVLPERRAPGAGVVAGAWSFHFDHSCAEVREQHRGVRPCEHAREVRDEQSVQSAHGYPSCMQNYHDCIQTRRWVSVRPKRRIRARYDPDPCICRTARDKRVDQGRIWPPSTRLSEAGSVCLAPPPGDRQSGAACLI